MAQGNGQPLEAWFLELVEEIRNWHSEALKTGGADGEHTARLHASVGRAFQSAFGRPAYATDFDKAGALFHGLVCNHPFVDGNKRTAVLTSILFLVSRGCLPGAPSRIQVRMLGELAIEAASSKVAVDEVIYWLHRVLDP